MVPNLLWQATTATRGTPQGAAGRGLAGGIVGALLLSVLSRVLPGLRAWRSGSDLLPLGGPPEATLARALTLPQSPGPEGLAEQFAFKLGAGVFGRDISRQTRLAGRAVHLSYGAAWGMLYGLLQASHRRPPAVFGAAYGLAVWVVGPAFLVPAMRLMGRPSEEPRGRTAALVVGHLGYGLALAAVFEALQREAR